MMYSFNRSVAHLRKWVAITDRILYPKEVFCPVEFETRLLRKTRKTVCIHWFSGSWQTQQEQEYLQKEARRLTLERRSARRVAIGTRLLGEKGYAKLKALLKGR